MTFALTRDSFYLFHPNNAWRSNSTPQVALLSIVVNVNLSFNGLITTLWKTLRQNVYNLMHSHSASLMAFFLKWRSAECIIGAPMPWDIFVMVQSSQWITAQSEDGWPPLNVVRDVSLGPAWERACQLWHFRDTAKESSSLPFGMKLFLNTGGSGVRGQADILLAPLNKCLPTDCLLVPPSVSRKPQITSIYSL